MHTHERMSANDERGGIGIFLLFTLAFSSISIFYFLIAKRCGASVCWKGAPAIGDLWNTVLVTLEDRGFAGYARSGAERE